MPNASKISAIAARYRAPSAGAIQLAGRANQLVRVSGTACPAAATARSMTLSPSLTRARVSSGVPFTSVITPTRGRPDELERMLSSLQAQDETDWEAVVVDDGAGEAIDRVAA